MRPSSSSLGKRSEIHPEASSALMETRKRSSTIWCFFNWIGSVDVGVFVVVWLFFGFGWIGLADVGVLVVRVLMDRHSRIYRDDI